MNLFCEKIFSNNLINMMVINIHYFPTYFYIHASLGIKYKNSITAEIKLGIFKKLSVYLNINANITTTNTDNMTKKIKRNGKALINFGKSASSIMEIDFNPRYRGLTAANSFPLL